MKLCWSQVHYITKDDHELLILKYWNYEPAPPYPVYAVHARQALCLLSYAQRPSFVIFHIREEYEVVRK